MTLTVTAEPGHGNEVLPVEQDQVTAYQDKNAVTVSRWIPAQGADSALELFLLIDDASEITHLGSQLTDLRQFVSSQAASTRTGVAYMQNGMARVLANPTADHAAAAGTLRLPLGAITAGASPYLSLSDLIKKWPATGARREVVMISSGIDALGGPPPVDPYLQTAIDDAQRAGVVVYSIYTPNSGHFGHTMWLFTWGQNYLSELSEETGGDSFGFGFVPPVSFQPYLATISDRLANQYRATVLLQFSKTGFQPVRLFSKVPNVDLATQTRGYVGLGG